MWFRFEMETPTQREETYKFYYAEPGRAILERDNKAWGLSVMADPNECSKALYTIRTADKPPLDWVRRRLTQAKMEHANIGREIYRLEAIVNKEAFK